MATRRVILGCPIILVCPRCWFPWLAAIVTEADHIAPDRIARQCWCPQCEAAPPMLQTCVEASPPPGLAFVRQAAAALVTKKTGRHARRRTGRRQNSSSGAD